MFLSSIKLPGSRLLQFATTRHDAGTLLSAKEFEAFLRRERSLADRGNRIFTLLVLRRLRGNPEDLENLGRRVRRRLRDTDLVGRLDEHRIGILLTDTRPEGATLIANWVDRALENLNLHTERKIYVYPSLVDAGAGTNGHPNGQPNEPGDKWPPDGGAWNGTTNGGGVSRIGGGAHGAPTSSVPPTPVAQSTTWSLEDLWVQLVEPLPLWKRTIDVAASGAGLVALAPLFLVVAAAIKLDSPGPVFYRSTRMGRGRKPFAFYKFRSMTADAEERQEELAVQNEAEGGPIFKIRNDPRMTRVGRRLRRWSIDELPQLWNVFRGDFSIVGPRPPIPHEVDGYQRWQKRRLDVAGGLTCIWQVSGRSEVDFDEWMRMDMRYIHRKGLWVDLKLIARTFKAVLSGRGAY